MKTAKAPSAEPSSARRAQPVRQTRTNPPRTTSGLNRAMAGGEALAGASGADQPIDIFPAVTHFADAIAALPKELVRHFTLLKEVDAKIFAPEEALFQLITAALDAPVPEPARSVNDASSVAPPVSASMSAQNSSSGVALNAQAPSAPSADGSVHAHLFGPSNIPRRQLFRQAAFKIQEMLVSLEEKNHVLSTANEALHKQLARIDDVWPHLEGEFSDEAKWGSTTHWAYPENRAARALNSQTERTRREGAASLSAAAQALAEEAAARSDARKQAVAAKKHQKGHAHQESDLDDHDAHKKGETARKTGGGKRKTAAAAPDATHNVGLGISSPGPANGNPAPKRRKVEKPANGGTPADRAMSSVFGGNAPKAKGSASPRETPAPDPAKKRKALPSSNGQPKKRTTGGAAISPSAASSPVIGAFAESTKPSRASPAPTSAARPPSSRARQNSIQSSIENGRQRPSSSASNKQSQAIAPPPEITTPANGARTASEAKTPKLAAVPAEAEIPKTETETAIPPPPPPAFSRKESTPKGTDEGEAKRDTTPASATATTTTLVTTKSGRASKPSTPALGNFPDNARSRASRGSDASATAKRSHKKGASAAAAAAAAKVLVRLPPGDGSNSVVDDDDEVDENEPTYCICNRVSFGEMVGCDGLNCKREWFHLECVGLKVAPKSNVKWYCEDCKRQLKAGSGKVNGR